MRWWVRAVLIGIGVVLILLSLIVGTDLLVVQYKAPTPALRYTAHYAQPAPPKDTLIVMTWNIKFGGARIDFFFDCYGDRVWMTRDEVYTNLTGLLRKIRQVQPDILLVQELDIDSKRSGYVDMLKYIADSSGLPYAAYASQWHVRYLPSRGLGAINSGNAIFSRWPIDTAYRLPLPLVRAYPWWYRLFYLRRNILIARISLPHHPNFWVLNTHLEAYVPEPDSTRYIQIQILKNILDSLTKAGATWVAGGDLNTVPPGTKKLKDFDDNACKTKDPTFVADDYTREVNWLLPLYQLYQEAIPLEVYQAREADFYSHTVNGRGWWNRRLDYLFTNARWINGLVHQDSTKGGMETFPLSDHAPVSGELILSRQ
ncbi:MAG: endonuclease/exonuclease/phosphatase family protein [Bacteroidia bacterium]|nr:endonuclease/exonuclease/phosphatase family protein [Bacteroidia bacterium]MCX7652032.1 endonuclease/exonuclease/phosphatase family protein [Bacteroidia bacterium]MDW8416297.1 endonuclease/exonuclease/phosphatase family protein [Bacteroidia bacterium]